MIDTCWEGVFIMNKWEGERVIVIVVLVGCLSMFWYVGFDSCVYMVRILSRFGSNAESFMQYPYLVRIEFRKTYLKPFKIF